MGISDIKTTALDVIDGHPRLLMVGIVVLICIILFYYFYSHGYIDKSSFAGKRKKHSNKMTDKNDLDSLIDSIHAKQARNKSN